MPPYNRLQRHFLGNQRAAHAARERKLQDGWQRARQKAKQLGASGSAVQFVDAIVERHQELGQHCRRQPVLIGYGDGTAAERRSRRRQPAHQPPHPSRLPPLSELTGRSRRTMMRAARELVELQILRLRRAGEPRQVEYPCRSSGEVHVHEVGRGGCMKDGIGLANAYWPYDLEDLDAEPLQSFYPPPQAPEPGPAAAPRPPLASRIPPRSEPRAP